MVVVHKKKNLYFSELSMPPYFLVVRYDFGCPLCSEGVVNEVVFT
jgi:hypothetical protein